VISTATPSCRNCLSCSLWHGPYQIRTMGSAN